MHSESIQTPSLFKFFVSYILIIKLIKFFFSPSLINLHTIPHNDKVKTGLDIFCSFSQNKKIKKLKYHIYISIQTLCYAIQNWAQVHPGSIDHPTTWLESTCGKFNWLDIIWKHKYIGLSI